MSQHKRFRGAHNQDDGDGNAGTHRPQAPQLIEKPVKVIGILDLVQDQLQKRVESAVF